MHKGCQESCLVLLGCVLVRLAIRRASPPSSAWGLGHLRQTYNSCIDLNNRHFSLALQNQVDRIPHAQARCPLTLSAYHVCRSCSPPSVRKLCGVFARTVSKASQHSAWEQPALHFTPWNTSCRVFTLCQLSIDLLGLHHAEAWLRRASPPSSAWGLGHLRQTYNSCIDLNNRHFSLAL